MKKQTNSIIMSPASEIRSLSTLLGDLEVELHDDTVSISDLLESLHERGIAMILLFFAAPMALPVPVPPGINVMLATPLLLLTGQQALGAHTIWLPSRIKQKKLSGIKIKHMIRGVIPWMERLETITRPRLGWLTQDGFSRFFGFLGLIMALTVCIPLPLTNTVPSLGIALMSVGFIMRDGLAVLAGAFIGMGWVLLLVLGVLFFGQEAFDIIKDFIKMVIA